MTGRAQGGNYLPPKVVLGRKIHTTGKHYFEMTKQVLTPNLDAALPLSGERPPERLRKDKLISKWGKFICKPGPGVRDTELVLLVQYEPAEGHPIDDGAMRGRVYTVKGLPKKQSC
jgi:hypothetical protein